MSDGASEETMRRRRRRTSKKTTKPDTAVKENPVSPPPAKKKREEVDDFDVDAFSDGLFPSREDKKDQKEEDEAAPLLQNPDTRECPRCHFPLEYHESPRSDGTVWRYVRCPESKFFTRYFVTCGVENQLGTYSWPKSNSSCTRCIVTPPDPWTWPNCAAFAANRWCCAYPARKRTRIASTSNALKGPAASFSGETNHPAVKSNAGSSKASTPNGAPSDVVLPLPCTPSVPGTKLPSRANGNPKAPRKSTSDGPWLANVDCTESTNRERAVRARTRRSKTWTPLRLVHCRPHHARQRVSRHRLGRVLRARRVSTPRTRVSQLARGCGTPGFLSTRQVPGFVRQGLKDRGGRPPQDSRTELPTLRVRRPDPPSQPPQPLAPTLPRIRQRASHRGGLQRGYRRKDTLVELGVTQFEFGIVGVPQVRRVPRTRPTPRPARGFVTQFRVSRRSHPPSLPRDRMSRLLVVVPTRQESRLNARELIFFYCTKGMYILRCH